MDEAMLAARLDAAEHLIDILAYNGTDRGYTRGSLMHGMALGAAIDAWSSLSGKTIDRNGIHDIADCA